ncbi:MAG: proton-conducting transporter membrane subunit [Planctomycetota bacterium]
MNHPGIVIFVMLPMVAAVADMLLHKYKKPQRVIAVGTLLGNMVAAIWALAKTSDGTVLVSQMGNWPAPFGISVIVDMLSAILLAVTSAVMLAVYIYSLRELPRRFAGGYFNPLYLSLLMGVNWAFITGDLFNLFVAFEIFLLSSYGILILGTTPAQMRQAYKYVLLNLFASTLFVAACGLTYGVLGTLNFAEIAALANAGQVPASMVPVAGLLLMVFAAKTAAFPLWFWLPDTYPTLPPAMGGLFSGLLTKVGVYTLLRVFIQVLGDVPLIAQLALPLILISAVGTMFGGVLGAVSSTRIRKILAIHVISQVGYMVLGIGLATKVALAAVVLYVVQHMVVKCALFLCAGLVIGRTGTDDLGRLGGLIKRDVPLAVLFFIAAMSLVGLPPLSGFYGKFMLITESFARTDWQGYVLGGFAIITGVLTLVSMVKIWNYAFWNKEQPGAPGDVPIMSNAPNTVGYFATGFLVLIALSVAFGAQGYLNLANVAAEQMLDAEAYVSAVLGDEAWAYVEQQRMEVRP